MLIIIIIITNIHYYIAEENHKFQGKLFLRKNYQQRSIFVRFQTSVGYERSYYYSYYHYYYYNYYIMQDFEIKNFENIMFNHFIFNFIKHLEIFLIGRQWGCFFRAGYLVDHI